MSEKKIFIEIVGQDAEECADVLSDLIYSEFGSRPEKSNPEEQYTEEGSGKKLDPASIGAIAGAVVAGLTIPGAILTTMHIKDRLNKKESFERLTEKGTELKEIKNISRIRFRIGAMEFEFEKAAFAKISDEISEKP